MRSLTLREMLRAWPIGRRARQHARLRDAWRSEPGDITTINPPRSLRVRIHTFKRAARAAKEGKNGRN